MKRQQHSGNRKPHERRRRQMALACAGVASALLTGSARAVPDLILDLRVAGTGGKTATVNSQSGSVNLELFALVADYDDNAANTGFNSTQGAWMSGTGGLLGNFSTSLVSPFNDSSGAQNPTPADLDSDGDLDVGAAASASSGFWIASAGANGSFTSVGTKEVNGETYRVFKIGTGTWTAAALTPAAGTTLNFIPRTGTALVRPHKYFVDSGTTLTSIKGDDARLQQVPPLGFDEGTAVSVTVAGISYTWTRGAGSGDWSVTGNWGGGGVPGILDTASFTSAGTGNINVAGSRTVGGMHFNHNSGNYSFTNGSSGQAVLTLDDGSGSGTITALSGGPVTFNSQVALQAANQLIVHTAGGGSTVTAMGGVSATLLSKTGPGTLVLGGTGTSSITDIVVAQGTVRSQSQQALGAARVTLSGGGLAVTNSGAGSGGTIALGNDVTVAADATIDVRNGGANIGNAVQLQALTIGGQTLTATGANDYALRFAGATTLTGNATINTATANVELTGGIAQSGGTRGLTKAGPGILRVSGTSSYAGQLLVNAGTFVAASPTAFGASTGGTIVADGATVSLEGHSYTAGELLVIRGNGVSGGTAGALHSKNGGSLNGPVTLAGNALVVEEMLAPLTFTGTVNTDGHALTVSGSHTFNGSVTGANGSLVITGGINTLGGSGFNTFSGMTTVSGGTLVLAKPDGFDAVGGDVTVNSGGTVRWDADEQVPNAATLTLNSGGTLDLNGHTETVTHFVDAGGTTVLGGTLNVIAGDVNLTDGTTLASAVNLSRDVIYTGTTTAATISGDLAMGAQNPNHNINVANGSAAADLVISGSISGSGTVTKTGAGTLRYSGATPNTYAALTTVSDGALELAKTGGATAVAGAIEVTAGGSLKLIAGNQIDDASTVTVGTGGTFNLNGQAESIGALNGGGAVDTGTGGHLTTGLGNASSTFSGTIAGDGNFTHAGSGTLTLAGASTLSGVLAVKTGVVSIASASPLGDGELHVSDGGTLRATASLTVGNTVTVGGTGDKTFDVAGGATLTLAADLIRGPGATGALVKTGVGTLALFGGATQPYAGNVRVAAGTLAIVGARELGSVVNVTIDPDGALDLSAATEPSTTIGTVNGGGSVLLGAGDLVLAPHAANPAGTFSGQIVGGGSLIHDSANATHLTGASTIGGDLRVKRGTVAVGAAGTFAASSIDVRSTGTDGVLLIEGAATAGAAHVGAGGVGAAHLNVQGASANLAVTTDLQIGGQGAPGEAGQLTVASGANVTVGGALKVWDSTSGGDSAVNLNGGTLSVGTIDTDGVAGGAVNWSAGALVVTGGDIDVNNAAPLGGNVVVGASKSLAVSNAARSLNIGAGGNASLAVEQGGSAFVAGATRVGRGSLGNGSLTVGGDGSSFATGTLVVGEGVGAVQVNAGGILLADGAASISTDAGGGSVGALNVAAGGGFSAGQLFVGGTAAAAGGSATVSSAGAIDVAGDLMVWKTPGGTSLVVAGGGSIAAGSVHLKSQDNTVAAGGVLSARGGGVTFSGNDSPTLALAAHVNAPGKLNLAGGIAFTGAAGTAAINSISTGDLPGTVDLNDSAQIISVADGSAAIDLTIGARLANGGITKAGAGTLELAGDNQYAQPTHVAAGTLVLGRNSAIPAASAVTLAQAATLDLAGHSTTVASLADGEAPGSGTLLLNGGALTAGADNAPSVTFSGNVAGGTGALVKEGSGEWTLAGDLGYSGTLDVNLGTVRLTAANASLAGTVTVRGSASAYGTLALSQDNLGSANLVLAGGHVRAEGPFAMSRDIALGVGGGAFDLAIAGQSVTVGGTLSGPGGLTKNGDGTLVLAGAANTYSGTTLIASDELRATATGALSPSSAVLVAADATLNLAGTNQTIGSLGGAVNSHVIRGDGTLTSGGNSATTEFAGTISGGPGGALVKAGSGALTLSGATSFGGGLTVNGGELLLRASPIGGNAIVNAGATLDVDSSGRLEPSSTITLNGGTFRALGGLANNVTLGVGGGTIDVPDAGGDFGHTGTISGSSALRKAGPGSYSMTQPAGLTGPVFVDGGLLQLGGTATISAATSVTVASGAVLAINNAQALVTDRLPASAPLALNGGTFSFIGVQDGPAVDSAGPLSVGPGAARVQLTQVGNGQNAFTFAGLSVAPGATLAIDLPGAGLTNQLFFTGRAAGFMGGGITVNGEFADYDPALGARPLDASAYSPTFANGAHVRIGADAAQSALPAIKTLTLDSTGPAVTITQDDAQTLTISEGGIAKLGSAAAKITGGPASAIASGNGRLDVIANGGQLEIESAITGAPVLSKSGTGTLRLSSLAALHDVGDIYVNEGTLQASDDASLGRFGNAVHFNGGTLRLEEAGAVLRAMHFDAGGGTLDVPAGALHLAATAQLQGAGPLVKDGAGTLVIGAANPFAGRVTVAGGSLELRHVDALGGVGSAAGQRSTITLAPGATLDLRSDDATANFDNDIVVRNNDGAAGNVATITTGPLGAGPAGQFRLGALRIGDATLANSGASGSLAFGGIVTLTGAAAFDVQRDLAFTDRVTGGGSLEKKGAATLALGAGAGDTTPNTYAGNTIITGGELRLNKAAGTIAIPGNIVMNGGSLVFQQERQIADTSTVSLGGGTFDLNGKSDSVKTLTNTGATVLVSGGTLTVGDSTFAGGTTIIGAEPSAPRNPGGGGMTDTPATDVGTISSNYTTDSLSVSQGTTRVNPSGSLNVGTGGLTFTGAASPAVTLVSDNLTPGRMVLGGDVINNSTAGTPQVKSDGSAGIAGTIELGDVVRQFVVNASSDLVIDSRVTKGGIRKSGSGWLVLKRPSEYTLGTTILSTNVQGALQGGVEAYDGALGSGPVTLTGNLTLRSDQPVAKFGNDLIANDATVRLDSATGGAAQKVQLNRLQLGSARMKVFGPTASPASGTLEFTGPVALTATSATVENYSTVRFANAVTGAANFTKDTGAGELWFTGAAANTYTGQTAVRAGKLVLDKPAGVNAIGPGAAGANNTLTASVSGSVEWRANDQVDDRVDLVVNGSGSSMNLNNFSDTVRALTLTGGATLATGPDGMLRLGGDVTYTGGTVGALISGNVDLNKATRTFNVANGGADDDLVVSANVSGAGGIVKAGAGMLVLSGNNSFTGGVSISGGSLRTTGATSMSGAPTLALAAALEVPGAFTTAPGTVITKTGAGSLTIAGPQTHGAGSQLLVQQGNVSLNTDAGAAGARNLNLSATGGSITLNQSQHLSNVTIGNGVTATLSQGGNKILSTDALTVASSGKIDLKNGTLVVATGRAGAFQNGSYTDITGLVAKAYNGGAWNGAGGITTTIPSTLNPARLTGLGVATATEAGITTLAGETLPGTAVVVKYTYGGDANLDGKLNGDDYFHIDGNINAPGASGWYRGDFDYNGKLNGDDYFILDANFSLQTFGVFGNAPGLPELAMADAAMEAGSTGAITTGALRSVAGLGQAVSPGSASAGAPAGVTAVPEPSALSLLALGAGALARRRRRRSASISR
ncbi:MAG TPA: autotransporter-associated beta strand repeat-containing protein [Tepidisphaeraceae bacterium]|nr:autotransporter-associated beta strand repeat-containing protein [Tepidisphaeraceae bacterium]